MFLTTRYSGYNRDGEQSAGGQFLIAASGEHDTVPNPTPGGWPLQRVYVAVRYVRLRQLGAWMMGSAQVGDMRLTLSGDYGSDGLTHEYAKLSERAREEFTKLSDDETVAFWKSEHPGHNSSGSERSMMKKIGLRLFRARKGI